jgi:hypothetical protein
MQDEGSLELTSEAKGKAKQETSPTVWKNILVPINCVCLVGPLPRLRLLALAFFELCPVPLVPFKGLLLLLLLVRLVVTKGHNSSSWWWQDSSGRPPPLPLPPGPLPYNTGNEFNAISVEQCSH